MSRWTDENATADEPDPPLEPYPWRSLLIMNVAMAAAMVLVWVLLG